MGRVRPVRPILSWLMCTMDWAWWIQFGQKKKKKKKKNPSPWTMHILPLMGRATGLDLMGYPWACISILFYYLFIKKNVQWLIQSC